MKNLFFFLLFGLSHIALARARDLGIPLAGKTGGLNAITDLKGVEVGHVTLISAAWFSLNGNGELTGTAWIEETGFLDGPIALTNTNSVGIARDAVQKWALNHLTSKNSDEDPASLPVVGETWDGRLNDIRGNHVTRDHVFEALKSAKSGPVLEGNVGGGTGMVSFGYKSGIGTSSREVKIPDPFEWT